MSNKKHTPGPWAFRPHKERKEHFFVLENAYIGPDINALIAQVKFEANAKLIAAAPDMLDILIKISRNGTNNISMGYIEKVIKKATK